MKEDKEKFSRHTLITLNEEQDFKLRELKEIDLQGISGIMRSALELYYSTIFGVEIHKDVIELISKYKKILS